MIMPTSSFMCVGLIAISSSVDMRPMWHSTQFTRAWNDAACATGSSGCTAWHTLVQNALLLLYSHATMPPAARTARAMPPTTNVVTAPSIKVRRPNVIFIADSLLVVLHDSPPVRARAVPAPIRHLQQDGPRAARTIRGETPLAARRRGPDCT